MESQAKRGQGKPEFDRKSAREETAKKRLNLQVRATRNRTNKIQKAKGRKNKKDDKTA